MGVFTITILSEGQKIDPTFVLMEMDVLLEINRIPYARLKFIDGEARGKLLSMPGRLRKIMNSCMSNGDFTPTSQDRFSSVSCTQSNLHPFC